MRDAAVPCPALTARAPRFDVVDTGSSDALVRSRRGHAVPVRPPGPEGFRQFFPDEGFYLLDARRDVAPLCATATDPNGIRNLSVVIPVSSGRPAEKRCRCLVSMGDCRTLPDRSQRLP